MAQLHHTQSALTRLSSARTLKSPGALKSLPDPPGISTGAHSQPLPMLDEMAQGLSSMITTTGNTGMGRPGTVCFGALCCHGVRCCCGEDSVHIAE